jgi:signal transduction histidine kinase
MIVPGQLSRGHVLIFGLLALAMVVTIALPEQAEIAGPLGVLIGYGSAGFVLVRKVRKMKGREKRAWSLVGLGFLVGAFGIGLVAAIQSITGSVSAFGPTDTIFILAYILVIAGFASLPHFPLTLSQRVQVYLDSMIGAVSLGAVMWVLALDDLLKEFATSSAWDRWAGTAYPIVDVAALTVVIMVSVRRSRFRFDPRLVFFAIGIILQSAADLRLLTTGVGKTFAEAQPNFTVFLLATTLYLAAAVIADRQPKYRAYADRRTPIWVIVTPYSVAVAMVLLLVMETRQASLSPRIQLLLTATYIVGALVIGRQGVAIRMNRLLVEKQRAELVSSISHELRTPLTAVVGFLDVINDDQTPLDDAERKDLIGVVQRQAQHMSTIVSDLILLARGSSDDMTLKEEVVPVTQVVENAIHAIDRLSVTFNTEVDPDLLARVDPGRVQQILINLLTNADRYGNGTGLIVVRREGSDLTIEVHDDGPGVPKKYEQTIWERFERGVNRLNASIPGSGIGLAVVAAITSAHGGSTGYRRSERLGGACFRVVLPNRIEGQVLMGM